LKREAVVLMCDATGLPQRRACRLTGCPCRLAVTKRSVRRRMRIHQGASLSWHWSAGVLATAASGNHCAAKDFMLIISEYTGTTISVDWV